MKNSFLVFAIIYLTTSPFVMGQEYELLALNENRPFKRAAIAAKKMEPNGEYLSHVAIGNKPSDIAPLQQQAAGLKLATLNVFNPEEPSSYFVVLDDKKSYIQARYNSKGNLISTKERHKNVPLASEIKTRIALEYPGWEVVNNLLVVQYTKGKKTKKRAKISLEKDKVRKVFWYMY